MFSWKGFDITNFCFFPGNKLAEGRVDESRVTESRAAENRVAESGVAQDNVTKHFRYLKWRYSPIKFVCKAYVGENPSQKIAL